LTLNIELIAKTQDHATMQLNQSPEKIVGDGDDEVSNGEEESIPEIVQETNGSV